MAPSPSSSSVLEVLSASEVDEPLLLPSELLLETVDSSLLSLLCSGIVCICATSSGFFGGGIGLLPVPFSSESGFGGDGGVDVPERLELAVDLDEPDGTGEGLTGLKALPPCPRCSVGSASSSSSLFSVDVGEGLGLGVGLLMGFNTTSVCPGGVGEGPGLGVGLGGCGCIASLSVSSIAFFQSELTVNAVRPKNSFGLNCARSL